jgi:hypothetical protein
VGFWGLWFQIAAGVVVGRNDYVVEMVGVEVDEGFSYAVVMAVVVVVVWGFGYAMELHALVPTNGEYQECTAFL